VSLLELGSVTVRYGGVKALDNVDLSVADGDGVAIIGPNGAGKTTLFNVIAGVHRPSSGSVTLDGRPVRGTSPVAMSRRGVARTFQVARPFGSLTVWDNVAIAVGGARHHRGLASLALRSRDREASRLVDGLLDRVGLREATRTPAADLTMGQLRRLEFARALAGRPRLLMLDEPAAGIGVDGIHDLGELIRGVRNEGVTVLLVEHYVGFALSLCERAVVLDMGRKIAEGTPEEIRGDERVINAYLGRSGKTDQPETPGDHKEWV
jgi:ABC-type branched-subunit amino acid transport system ATPase component